MGYEHSYFAFAYYNIEQELYLPRLIDAYGRGTVTQQHFRANPPNLEILRQFGIRPVVLVRNIFDVIVSMRDHLLRERLDNLPSVYAPIQFAEFDDEKQIDYLITYVAPWLITFYVSWHNAFVTREYDFCWLSYEDMIRNWPTAIANILKFYNQQKTSAEIEIVLHRMSKTSGSSTRFNQGVSGRGHQLMSLAQKERIQDMTQAYSDVDFAKIGID